MALGNVFASVRHLINAQAFITENPLRPWSDMQLEAPARCNALPNAQDGYLPTPRSGRVSHVVHLGDLHVRSGDAQRSRYAQYHEVFEATLAVIATLQCVRQGSAVALLAGDTFHDRFVLQAPGLILVQRFLDRLADLAPVLIIRGNHDYRQDAPEHPDLVAALTARRDPRISYLKDRGLYRMGDLIWGLLPIQDVLQPGAASGHVPVGLVEPLRLGTPDPPPRCSIALFHGPLVDSASPGAFSFALRAKREEKAFSFAPAVGQAPCGSHPMFGSAMPVHFFSEFDLLLAGDIHAQQVHRATRLSDADWGMDDLFADDGHQGACFPVAAHCWRGATPPHGENSHPAVRGDGERDGVQGEREGGPAAWGYSGSLVQQNHGEPLFPHGFLVWDLDRRRVFGLHVRNACGFLTLGGPHASNLGPVDLGRVAVDTPDDDAPVPPTLPPWFPTSVDLRVYSPCVPSHALRSLAGRGVAVRSLHDHTLQDHTLQDHTHQDQELQDYTFAQRTETEGGDEPLPSLRQYLDLQDSHQDSHQDNWHPRAWLDDLLLLSLPAFPDAPPALAHKVAERNRRFERAVADLGHCLHPTGPAARSPIKLLRLEWDWMLCYGPGNSLDFAAMDTCVVRLVARNAVGKSSLFEVILLALFGKGIPSRCGADLSCVVNRRIGLGGDRCNAEASSAPAPTTKASKAGKAKTKATKPAPPQARTLVTLRVGQDTFQIERTFADAPAGPQASKKPKATCKVLRLQSSRQSPGVYTRVGLGTGGGGHGEASCLKSGPTAVQAWVAENVGCPQDFLRSCFVTQDQDGSFFGLPPQEQVALLTDCIGQDLTHAQRACSALDLALTDHRSVHGDLAAALELLRRMHAQACADLASTLAEDLAPEVPLAAKGDTEREHAPEDAESILQRGLDGLAAREAAAREDLLRDEDALQQLCPGHRGAVAPVCDLQRRVDELQASLLLFEQSEKRKDSGDDEPADGLDALEPEEADSLGGDGEGDLRDDGDPGEDEGDLAAVAALLAAAPRELLVPGFSFAEKSPTTLPEAQVPSPSGFLSFSQLSDLLDARRRVQDFRRRPVGVHASLPPWHEWLDAEIEEDTNRSPERPPPAPRTSQAERDQHAQLLARREHVARALGYQKDDLLSRAAQRHARAVADADGARQVMEGLPFNPECWACQAAPHAARVRQLDAAVEEARGMLVGGTPPPAGRTPSGSAAPCLLFCSYPEDKSEKRKP